jgi:hypothetical protein
MGFTLRQAAKQAKVSPTTISRALKIGRLSGSKDEDGVWSIDPAELARVFPITATGNGSLDKTEQAQVTGVTAADVMTMKVEMLEQQLVRERQALDREQEMVADLQRRLDKAEERVFALTMEGKTSTTNRPSWWSKLTGG